MATAPNSDLNLETLTTILHNAMHDSTSHITNSHIALTPDRLGRALVEAFDAGHAAAMKAAANSVRSALSDYGWRKVEVDEEGNSLETDGKDWRVRNNEDGTTSEVTNEVDARDEWVYFRVGNVIAVEAVRRVCGCFVGELHSCEMAGSDTVVVKVDVKD